MNLFLIGTLALVALLVSIGHSQKLHGFLEKRLPKKQVVPKAITTLVMTAQLSELVRTVEHVDIVHISAAIMLLAIIVATKSGTESELH
jgi:MFS-type transporter involved in bile tolerance (Atg22 family)